MPAFEQFKNYFPEGLASKAESLGYSKPNILILEGKEEELKQSYPEVYANIQSCKHNKDDRKPIEYAQDLVASWIFEDVLIKDLADNGCVLTLNGADKKREILKSSKVSSSSDAILEYEGKSCPIEIMTDYTDYWQKKLRLDLRDDKCLKMCHEKSILLGIAVPSSKYILLDFAKDLDATWKKYHAPYHKPAYSIKLSSEMESNIDFQAMAEDLINHLKNRE